MHIFSEMKIASQKNLAKHQSIDFKKLKTQLYGNKDKKATVDTEKPYKEDFFSNFETWHVASFWANSKIPIINSNQEPHMSSSILT